MDYNMTDYAILNLFSDSGIENEVKSCTISYLVESLSFSESKIRQSIKRFIKDGMIKEGLKVGQSKTYYITEKGISVVFNIKRKSL